MSDILIEYSSEDRDKVKPLVKALEDTGWSVFWDRSIPGGNLFIGSQYCVVVLWSCMSIRNRRIWSTALKAMEKSILVVAVIEDNTEIPVVLREAPSVDLSQWDGNRLAASFGKLQILVSLILGNYIEKEAQLKDPNQAIEILYQGVQIWNEYRRGNPQIDPDLRTANLSKLKLDLGGRINLTSVNFSCADLRGLDFLEANLTGADLSWAKLQDANLSQASLKENHTYRGRF